MLVFSGSSSNTYTGDTAVNQGTLVLSKSPGINAVPGLLSIGDGLGGADTDIVRLDAAQQMPIDSSVTLNSSGLLNLNNFNQSFAALSGNGHVDFGGSAAILTLGSVGASATFSGAISGAGQLVKAGAGTLVLSGTSAFTGQTFVKAGQLLVNGSQIGFGLAGCLRGGMDSSSR